MGERPIDATGTHQPKARSSCDYYLADRGTDLRTMQDYLGHRDPRYAVASVAADVFKIAAPLLALSLWSKRFHILAVAGLVLWLGCVGWSMASAVGFVLSSRGDAIAERAAEAATRHGWEAKVERRQTLASTGRLM